MPDGVFRRRNLLVGGAALIVGGAAADSSTRIAAGGTERPRAAADAPPPPTTEVGLAAGSVLLWASEDELRRTLDAAVAARVRLIRFDVSWNFAEPRQGQFHWGPSDRLVGAVVDRGLRPLATVTNSPSWAALGGLRQTARPVVPATYADFAARVAERYRGSVDVYEIWNEPNTQLFFEPQPDPAFYTQMLRLAYERIKAVDPKATVLGGALGAVDHTPKTLSALDFLKDMYANGARDHFDALSFHPYDYGEPFAGGTVYPNSPMSQMVAMYEVMTRNGDRAKSIWITEYGAPSGRVGGDRQAELIVESIEQWQEVDYAGPFFVHTIRDDPAAPLEDERSFGVIDDHYRPKEAFVRLQALLAGGLSRRDVDARFRANRDPALGAAVSPVFALQEGFGQRFEHGFRYDTPKGFVNASNAVGVAALPWRLSPNSRFARGYQDFGNSSLRVFSHERFGTHAVFGAILLAWTPSLGYPTSDEYTVGAGRHEYRTVDFEHGTITWSEAGGARVGIR